MIHTKYTEMLKAQNEYINRENSIDGSFYNGIYDKYINPVITREHIPLHWRYDINSETNPLFMERLGVNAAFNSGAIIHEGKYWLCVRVEGSDRKSFFAMASSDNPVEGFRFAGAPIIWEDLYENETNMYDMRLVKHEDGWIYGTYCSESKDTFAEEGDTSSAIAQAGLVRTKDLMNWERLPNIKTSSPQERNVVLHPEFVNGRYAFYTRPQDGFISTGSGGGIAFGTCADITKPNIEDIIVIDKRKYHTVYEAKNGQGPAPIKTPKGWMHFAHGVRNTAAGLRYVLYVFATSLNNPAEVIAKPGGYFIAPMGRERTGDVSNVVFCNGAVANEKGEVYIYYASSDTRLHVASTTIEKLTDYAFNTPEDKYRALDCAKQRAELIAANEKLISESE